jgi:hypothetical protein
MENFATPKQIIARACETTGLKNFGGDGYLEGLEILCRSASEEARFTDMGRAAFEGQLTDHLMQRLQVEDWYGRHPEIDEQEIVAPLIGLGLPRTGSTALSCLLAEDPAARSLRNWEAMRPCPPPEFATQHSDPRIALGEAAMERRNTLFPRARQMLPSTATGPSECQTFMAMDMKAQLFQAFAHIPSYIDWLNHKADLVPTYTYVKRILKLLQWKCGPNNWRLKNPSHSLFIEALNTVFPDARFWMTHRDITNVIPSVADLYFEYSKAFSDSVDKHWLGEITSEFCELGMRRMIAFRDAGNDQRFFDIHFAPFQKDPFPKLAELYGWLGEDLSAEALANMRAWRENSPRDKHGGHSYDAAEFGIDLATLRQRFAFYSDRFGAN